MFDTIPLGLIQVTSLPYVYNTNSPYIPNNSFENDESLYIIPVIINT